MTRKPNRTVDRRPAEVLWRAIFAAIPPIPSLTISAWAKAYRVLSGESSFRAGRFTPFEYQSEPMDAPLDPRVIETVLWWAAQTGKSETVNNVSGYYMHADPAPQLLVQPTVDLAKSYSEERIAPMIRDCAVLRRIVKDPRSRDSGNKTLSKRYPGGNIALVGANSPSGLAGRPRRVILLDEVDRFPSSAGSEGDPCFLADKRAESFPNAIKLKTSTATVKGASKIEALFEQSDKRKWHVRCRCKHEWVFGWKDVVWDDGKPETARISCPSCARAIDDPERARMVRAGRWIATAPFRGVRGYWLNGINTLFPAHKGYANRIHQFVAEFLKAKDGGKETMRAWINTFLAETYEEEATRIDSSDLVERVEAYEPLALPEGVLILTAGADVQRMRIECEIKGWGKDEESWGVEHLTFDGDTERDEVWQKFDDALLREFEREDGVRMKIARTFVDMGYRDKRVLSFCAPRIGRGVYPCRGINRVGLVVPPILPAKPSRNNKARIPHWNVGVTVAKTTLYDRLSLAAGGARTMHFPSGLGYDEEYFRQFTIEKRLLKFAFGQPYYIFEKDNSSVRNEALDLNVYNLAALNSLFPISWAKLANNLKASAPRPDPQGISKDDLRKLAADSDPKPPAPKPATKMRPRSGFVRRWKN